MLLRSGDGAEVVARLIGESPRIESICFSPDGRLLATASGDLTSTSVKVWNVATGAETLSLVGHTARVRGVDFSPDGKMVATGSRDGTIRVWSSVDGRELKKLVVEKAGQPEETEDLHFTPDGAKGADQFRGMGPSVGQNCFQVR